MSRLVIKGKIQHMPHHGSLMLLIPAMVAIISLASLLLLLQTGRVITSSYDLRHLEEVRAQWQARNQQLEAEIAALQSLDNIEQRAKELGMVPANSQFYVSLLAPDVHGSAAQPVQPPPAEANPASNWWEDFLTWIGFRERAVNR